MKPKVIFRLDCNPDLGMGHLSRCRVLAQSLLTRNYKVCFLLSQLSEKFIDLVKNDGFGVKIVSALPGSAEDLCFLKELLKSENSILIVDHPGLDKFYLEEGRKSALLSVTITDSNRFPFPSDIVINQSAFAPLLKYRSVNPDCEFLLGPRFFLMSEKIKVHLAQDPVKESPPRNILVVMGGSDSIGLTGILLKALDQCPGSFYITALVGPLNENASGIKSVIARMRKEAELIIGAENVYPYFASADFALSAAGVTALELAALRVPALLFPQNRGERLNARSLQASGSALCYSDVLSISSIARTIEDLCQKPETLAKISRKAGKMFDGQGASRIISAIEEKLK